MIDVSIIIPFYNEEKDIELCLKKVLSQSLKNIEIICINDCSTDKTAEIIKHMQMKDNRIILVEQEKLGVGEARNKGMQVASGEYIIFMDADDCFYTDEAVNLLYKKIKEVRADVCGGNYVVDSILQQAVENEGWVNFFEQQITIGFWRFIYKRKFIINNNILFPNTSMGQDLVFLIRVLSKARRYYGINDIIYNYRIDLNERKYYKAERLFGDIKSTLLIKEIADANNLKKLSEWCENSLSYSGKIYASELMATKIEEIRILREEVSNKIKGNIKIKELYEISGKKLIEHISYAKKEAEEFDSYLINNAKNILIFGSSEKARQANDYLKTIFADRIKGFLVSDNSQKSELDNMPVYNLDMKNKNDFVVVIAVKNSSFDDVRKLLDKNGYSYIDFYIDDFYYLGMSKENMRYAYG